MAKVKKKKSEKTKGRGKTKKPDGLKDFSKATSRAVRQAAKILDDEISAGVIAAKEVKDRLLNVVKAKPGNDDLGRRVLSLKKDTHDVLNVFFDILTSAVDTVDKFQKRKTAKTPAKASKPKKEIKIKNPKTKAEG